MTKGWGVSRRRPLFLRGDPAFAVQEYPIGVAGFYLPVAFPAAFLVVTFRAVPVLPFSPLLRRIPRWLNEVPT
jgi:hypothetical protein